MRLTAEEVRSRGIRARVFLDGVELRDVVAADEEKRCLTQLRRNAEGWLYLDIEGCVATETRYGTVHIEIIE